MNIQQAFEEYVEIAEELRHTVFKYSRCFSEISRQELKEQVFHQKVSLKEKESLKNEIEKLENDIQDLYVEFLNCTNVIRTALEQEQYINVKVAKSLNNNHVEVFLNYIPAQKTLKHLKKSHPKYDFTKVTNVIAMERQKELLNEAIEDFNFRLLSDSKIRLWTVDECIIQARKELSE